MAEYDLVVRNGTLATASDVFRADLGVIDGRIATIGAKLGAGRQEINAEGHIVTPGGVDSHDGGRLLHRHALGSLRRHYHRYSLRRAISRHVATAGG